VALNRVPVAINQDMKSMECGRRLSPDFPAHFLKASSPIVLSWVRATTADNFSIDNLRELKIPLPPLDEQRRIATILDKADSLRRKRRKALELFNSLSQSIFVAMFGAEQSKSPYPTKPLGTLCNLVRGSSPRPQGDPRFFGGPVPRLMIADITRDGMMVTPAIDSLTAEGARRSRPMEAGSVVMAVSGAVGLPGILAVDACIHDGFVGFRSLASGITPEFLYYWLLSERAENSSRGTGAIWVNLTTDQVWKLEVPIPPLTLQKRFARLAGEVLLKKSSFARHGIHLDTLFASLQHRAFRGEL
jgi:restriction endonuclease S subunit